MPAGAQVELHRQLAPYRRAFAGVRWTRPQAWHLTLLFLGSVAPDRVPELEQLIEHVATQVQPYRVRVDRGGGRTREDDGLAWLGLSESAATLIEVATLAAEACPVDITDGPPPKRTPSAHLTVARKADRAVVQAVRDQTLGALGVSWRVDRLQLVRSFLEPGGARYQTLHERTL